MKYTIKRIGCGVLCAGLLFSFAACQKNPDASIVKNKNLDNLIEQANGGDGADVLSQKYDTYKTTIQDDALHVTVNVDAQVDIPQTDKLSVFRVKQKPITDELLARVKSALIGDIPLYDGDFLRIQTKADIEPSLASYRQMIERLHAESPDLAAYRYELDALLADYEAAPDKVEFPSAPNDGKLKSVADCYNRNPDNTFYKWLYNLNPDGTFYYGVSGEDAQTYASVFVYNNKDRDNILRVRLNPYGYEEGVTAAVASQTMLRDSRAQDGFLLSGALRAEEIENILEEYSEYDRNRTPITVYPEETCALSKDDAVARANAFLTEIGISGYGLAEGDLFTEDCVTKENAWIYRPYYILKYKRNPGGVFVNNAGGKFAEDWQSETYSKKEWNEECIEFRINDSGIVGFDWYSPLEITETVEENAALRSFDDVKATFEKMVAVSNASEYNAVEIDIDRVRLGYSRISEKDSWDTGLLVPVWDFFGTVNEITEDGDYYNLYAGDSEFSVMTVNAIDGSIINSELGY